MGLTSSFFFMSSGLPERVTEPAILYLTTLGLVEIAKTKLRVTSFVPFLSSSSFALMSKNSSSLEENCPVLSPCKLVRFIETMTPETAYCGGTANSSCPTSLLSY